MRPEDSDLDDLVLGLHYCDNVARLDDRRLITARPARPQWARSAFPAPPEELKSHWHDVDIRHL